MAGLYFHIPFCKRVCAYCDFFKSVELTRSEEVLQAMERELAWAAPRFAERRMRTLYFGGGTPSLWQPEWLQRLIGRAEELFDCSAIEECTVEANPDDLTAEWLEGLRRTRVDRLSIGIQSFDDGALKMMNRRHTAQQAAEAVARARKAGFENLTVDLIYGLPGFGGASLERSLQQVVALDVPHVSAYHLTIEGGTALGRRMRRGEFAPVAEEVSEREFERVHRVLTDAGYEHYEVSNFARSGFRARHNSAYWHGVPYLGIGPAAHSFDGAERRWSPSSLDDYVARAGSEALYEVEHLSERDRWNETLMTALRTADGVELAALAGRFGPERVGRLRREAARFESTGELLVAEGRIRIPAERFLTSDAVIAALFEV